MNRVSIDQTGINQINEITKRVYRLAKDDDLSDMSPSQDPCLLNEWHFNYFPQIGQNANNM